MAPRRSAMLVACACRGAPKPRSRARLRTSRAISCPSRARAALHAKPSLDVLMAHHRGPTGSARVPNLSARRVLPSAEHLTTATSPRPPRSLVTGAPRYTDSCTHCCVLHSVTRVQGCSSGGTAPVYITALRLRTCPVSDPYVSAHACLGRPRRAAAGYASVRRR